MDWAKTTSRGYKKHLRFGIWCDLFWRFYGTGLYSHSSNVITCLPLFQSHTIGPRSASFQWSQPSFANGIIQGYTLYAAKYNPSDQTLLTPVSKWQGLSRATTVNDLIPYTNYTFYVEACTPGGCLESDRQVVITSSTLPQQQPAPTVSDFINGEENFGLIVSWDYPSLPNGKEIFICL